MALLHKEVAQLLRERLASGEYSSADMANAIRFLKDNGIEADPDTNTDLKGLSHEFPSFKDELETSVN